jgi:hypothetical protein
MCSKICLEFNITAKPTYNLKVFLVLCMHTGNYKTVTSNRGKAFIKRKEKHKIRYQASAAKQVRTAFFWVITQG